MLVVAFWGQLGTHVASVVLVLSISCRAMAEVRVRLYSSCHGSAWIGGSRPRGVDNQPHGGAASRHMPAISAHRDVDQPVAKGEAPLVRQGLAADGTLPAIVDPSEANGGAAIRSRKHMIANAHRDVDPSVWKHRNKYLMLKPN